MEKDDLQHAVALRYSALAGSGSSLSCGGAVRFAGAARGEVCVDLGCGRGNDALRLAREVGLEGFVHGFDLSGEMIREARSRARREGIAHASFREAAMDEIPLDGESARLLVSNCAINHAADKERVWREIFRILEPGGRFVVSDIYSLRPVPKEYSNDPTAVAECWAGAVTKNLYLKTVSDAGFIDLEMFEESDSYRRGAALLAHFTLGGRKPVS